MGLLNPSPGEVIDRLTILELKVLFGKKKNVNVVHFEAEKVGLEERLKHFMDCLTEDFVYGHDQEFQERQDQIALFRNGLAAVNSLLWHAEDEVRATEDTHAFKLASLCKRIAGWNDARARYVRDLNKLYGLADELEKLHDEKKLVPVTDVELGMN